MRGKRNPILILDEATVMNPAKTSVVISVRGCHQLLFGKKRGLYDAELDLSYFVFWNPNV